MGRPSKIHPDLYPAIMEKVRDRLGCREIAAWLGKEHGIQVGHVTVAGIIAAQKKERKEIAQAVTREKLSKSLLSDLDVFGQLEQEFLDFEAELRAYDPVVTALSLDPEAPPLPPGYKPTPVPAASLPEGHLKLILKSKEDRLRLVDRKLHYSGAGEDEPSGGALRAPGIFTPPEADE